MSYWHFYTPSNFPKQWVLALSESLLFEGHVWCSTAIETEVVTHWAPCDWSPATFSRTMLFSGVVHAAQVSAPMNRIQVSISRNNLCSELDHSKMEGDMPWGSDKYIVMALWRLGFSEERFIYLPNMNLKGLASRIKACLPHVSRVRQSVSGNLFPAVSLDGGVTIGRSAP